MCFVKSVHYDEAHDELHDDKDEIDCQAGTLMREEGWLKDLDNWSGTENQREDREGEESNNLSERLIDVSLIAEAESEVLDDDPHAHDCERYDRQPRFHVPHDRLVQDAADHQDSMDDVIRAVVVKELLEGKR